MFEHRDLVLRLKRLDRQCVVCRRAVIVKNASALLSHFRPFSSHPFTKDCQNLLIVHLVNSLNLRHSINVNNPSDIEKTIIIALKLYLLFNLFPSLFKSFETLENLSTRQTFITIILHQQPICFCSEFSKFL
jgi:hypothetical protein